MINRHKKTAQVTEICVDRMKEVGAGTERGRADVKGFLKSVNGPVAGRRRRERTA